MNVDEALKQFEDLDNLVSVPQKDREALTRELEVGQWPGDEPHAQTVQRGSKASFDALAAERRPVLEQVKRARAQEAEFHPFPRLERATQAVTDFFRPSSAAPESVMDLPEPTPAPNAFRPQAPPDPTSLPSRFHVDEGEIVDTKAGQIISPEDFNRRATAQDKADIEHHLRAQGLLADDSSTEPASAVSPRPTMPVAQQPPAALQPAPTFEERNQSFQARLGRVPALDAAVATGTLSTVPTALQPTTAAPTAPRSEVEKYVTEPLTEFAKSAVYRGPVAFFDWLDRKSGQAAKAAGITRTGKSIYTKIADLARSHAEEQPTDPAWNTQFLSELGQIPTRDLPKIAAFTASLGPVWGFAGLGLLDGAEHGTKEALVEGFKGLLLGGAFKGMQGLGMKERAVAGGGLFGSQAFAEGERDPGKLAGHALTGAILGAPGGVKGETFGDRLSGYKASSARPPGGNIFENLGVDPETATLPEVRRAFRDQAGTIKEATVTAKTDAERLALTKQFQDLRRDLKDAETVLGKTRPATPEAMQPSGPPLALPPGTEPKQLAGPPKPNEVQGETVYGSGPVELRPGRVEAIEPGRGRLANVPPPMQPEPPAKAPAPSAGATVDTLAKQSRPSMVKPSDFLPDQLAVNTGKQTPRLMKKAVPPPAALQPSAAPAPPTELTTAVARADRSVSQKPTAPVKTQAPTIVQPGPNAAAEEPIKVADIHRIADEKGIPWDGDQAFMDLTKELTGKSHLDDLTPEERQTVYEALQKKPRVQTTAQPSTTDNDAAFTKKLQRTKHFLDTSTVPDYAKQAIVSQERMLDTNKGVDAHLTDATWKTETVTIESLRKNNEELWGKNFKPRGSVSVGPIVLDREGQIIDGNNRTFEAVQRGDTHIKVLRPTPSELPTKQAVGPPATLTPRPAQPKPTNPLDQAAHEAATSPTNALIEPTKPQQDAGNYKKGHVSIAGLDVSIENPADSVRSGTDKGGKPWSITMKDHYGYIRGTKGKDKEHIDSFIKPGTPEDYSGPVFVVDQVKPDTGHLDEHKVILGAATMKEGRQLYQRNYAEGWNGMGAIRQFTMPQFKTWLKEGDHTKPVSTYTIPTPSEPATTRLPTAFAPGQPTAPPVALQAQTTTKSPASEPFALTSDTPPKSKAKKPEQLGISVPPPTVGEKPIIGREVAPEEAPLFSKAAQQPDDVQTSLPESAMDKALRSVGLDPNAPPDKAKALRRKADRLTKSAVADLSGIVGGQPIRSTADRNRRDRAMEKHRKASDLIRQAEAIEASRAKETALPETAKEPWEMTQEEYAKEREGAYIQKRGGSVPANAANSVNMSASKQHERLVKEAIAEGKPVPPEVLADYPDLTEAKSEPEPAKAPTAILANALRTAADEIEGTPSKTLPESEPAKLTELGAPVRDQEAAPQKRVKPSTPRIPVAPIPGGTAKPLTQILIDVSKGTGQKLTKATLRAGVAGTYFPGSTATTIRYAGDLDTTAHELSHALDDRFGIVKDFAKTATSPFDAELKPFAEHGSIQPTGPRSSPQYVRAEGVAEWFRAWLVNPKAAEAAAPQFATHALAKLTPETRKALDQFSTDIRTFAGSSAHSKIMANVQWEVPKSGVLDWLTGGKTKDIPGFKLTWADTANAELVDRLNAFNQAIDYARRQRGMGQPPLPANDPQVLVRLYSGIHAKMDQIFEKGMIDTKNQHVTKGGLPWLVETLDPKRLDAEMQDVASYMIAQRTVEKITTEIDQAVANIKKQQLLPQEEKEAIRKATAIIRHRKISGAGGGLEQDIQVAEQHLNDLKAADPKQLARLDTAATRYRQWADANLQYLLDRGRISQDQYDAITANNEYYVSMQRILEVSPGEELALAIPSGSGSPKLGAGRQPIQAFHGSTRTIRNPYTTLMEATYRTVREADRNYVMSLFRDLLTSDRGMYEADRADLASVGRRAKEGEKETIPIYKHGEKEIWQFHPDVYKALKGVDDLAMQLPAFLEVLTYPAKIMRIGITKAPPFALRNLIRDAFQRTVVSNNGSKPWDSLKKYSRTEMDAMALAGGDQAGYYYRDDRSYQQAMKQAMHKLSGQRNVVVASLSKLGTGYSAIIEGSERQGRMAEYRRAFKKGKTQLGYDDYNAALYAASQARGILDFAIAGNGARVVNRFVPFLTAAINGLRVAGRSLKTHPVRTAALWFAYVAAPTLLTYFWNQAHGDLEEYRQLPPYQRDLFWNFKVAPDLWLTIPKPFELGAMATTIERMVDHQNGNDKAFEGHWKSLAKSLLPVDEAALFGPLQSAGSAVANYDFFRDRAIVPRHEENLELGLRSTYRASRLGQVVQEAIGVDARKIDFVVENQLGYFGRYLTSASDVGRTDRQGFGPSATGVLRGDPVETARDVKWVHDLAVERGALATKEWKRFQHLKTQFHKAEGAEQREAMGREVREAATRLRARWEARPPRPDAEKKIEKKRREVPDDPVMRYFRPG